MVKSLIYKRVGVAQKDDLWDVDAIHERFQSTIDTPASTFHGSSVTTGENAHTSPGFAHDDRQLYQPPRPVFRSTNSIIYKLILSHFPIGLLSAPYQLW
ncbi:hypothetical protein KC367_g205 [Hortaea werneckii]|nr:hypothetical protein KC367_g205 [Hortaea werneckii]